MMAFMYKKMGSVQIEAPPHRCM